MIPQKTDEKWKLLVTGRIEHDFKAVPAGLMLSMIKRQIKGDNSDAAIDMCINKIYDFFQRFESILQEDINAIFNKGQAVNKGSVVNSVYSRSENSLISVNEVSQMIAAGEKLFLAGDESALSRLPKGKWIGGTIPYFMSESGGVSSKDKIFVTKVPDYIQDITIKLYDEKEIDLLIKDRPEHGFSFIIIPAKSGVHVTYAQQAPNRANLFMKPTIGWIAGVHLNDLDKITPKVFNGSTGEKTDNKAVVMHLGLPAEKMAVIGIVNIFRQGVGDTIQFEKSGFSTTDCRINGAKINFSEYLWAKKIDTKLPLVANYSGAMVNVSFQGLEEEDRTVNFYAPVFKDVEYKLAMPIKDYVNEFIKHIPDGKTSPIFSCNCILNYLYSELEGKKTGNITGPVTFGEIAYQLLNQTLTYIDIKELR
jgi:hypothetical protein